MTSETSLNNVLYKKTADKLFIIRIMQHSWLPNLFRFVTLVYDIIDYADQIQCLYSVVVSNVARGGRGRAATAPR